MQLESFPISTTKTFYVLQALFLLKVDLLSSTWFSSGICASRCRVQASNNHGEVNLAMVFVTICSIFVCCHILRIILALQAFTRASEISDCIASNKSYIPPIELVCMESISHIMIMINSSCNFIVYCTLSTHFKVIPRNGTLLLIVLQSSLSWWA